MPDIGDLDRLLLEPGESSDVDYKEWLDLKDDNHRAIIANGIIALANAGFNGGGTINVPWGVSIDGNDNVWVANFWGRGVVLMAGAEPNGATQGAKTGDVVHIFTGGTIQMVTDVVVDPAGNVWAANNWNSPEAAVYDKPP